MESFTAQLKAVLLEAGIAVPPAPTFCWFAPVLVVFRAPTVRA
ncbi:MAG: hypothetical protein NTY05_14085 [Rhodocyclales bacterium]|nr:hypothetical protein [Rhodocyclales bacterium]